MGLVAPMPNASVTTTTELTSRCFRRRRAPNVKSRRKVFMVQRIRGLGN
jgi:hypothetical protein